MPTLPQVSVTLAPVVVNAQGACAKKDVAHNPIRIISTQIFEITAFRRKVRAASSEGRRQTTDESEESIRILLGRYFLSCCGGTGDRTRAPSPIRFRMSRILLSIYAR